MSFYNNIYNRIKPLSEAFKKNPVKEEAHKGKINS